MWTGQRQGDLLRLTCNAYDGQFIRHRQSKTGVHVTVPVGKPLKAILDATPRLSPYIITSENDRPYTSDGFRATWRKTCDRGGVKGLTFVTLRARPRSGGFVAQEFGSPFPREGFSELSLRRVGDPGENVGEPSLRIDVIELCGLDERVHQGRPFRPAL